MERYGLIGFPLGHSFSQKFFSDFFKRNGISAEYLNYEIADLSYLMELIAEYPEIRGLNVTIPYKEEVMGYLQEISDEAKSVGAVNVIKISYPTPDSAPVLHGYNTDVIGFRSSLLPLLDSNTRYKALVLGTGGASKAVTYVLTRLGIDVIKVSRSGKDGAMRYENLTPELIAERNLIVNTTPLGTYPDTKSCPDIPYEGISSGHVCYDLVYNPAETMFMKRCVMNGATVKNGLEMLETQALESWKIWNDK